MIVRVSTSDVNFALLIIFVFEKGISATISSAYFIGSIYVQSVATARAEQALSDVTSSLCSNLPRAGSQRAWHLQLKVRSYH